MSLSITGVSPAPYASGVTLAMVLGVALLVYFVVRRVSPAPPGCGWARREV